ncbi:non-homologous end-joining DNA ligase [Microbacterium sp. B19]|uniref:non-homologous end-joining DNA ligase n=1 Tax=Microbacterium sp. B19 TaxID=96765 RepID=UPI00034941BC|nr:non-homologous end-joining DNA ligase [Microbacterium sp. B19]
MRLALIRTEGSGEKSQWLLHRMKTDADGRPQGEGAVVVPRADSAPAATADLRPMLATSSTPGLARASAERWGREWVEMKWDGIRGIGMWDGERLRLRSRNGNDLTATYPELTSVDLGLGAAPAVIDGEIVALDAQGRPSFPLLQKRMNLAQARDIAHEAARTPVHLYLFDLLEADGRDVTGLPLEERREILERLAADAVAVVVVPPVFDDVEAALAASGRFGLEGIVVKDPAAPYRRGQRSDRWLKVKHSHTQEVVIGGIRPGKGNRSGTIGSLLVGVPTADGLQYAGRVGSGFGEQALARLSALLEPLRTEADPFVGVPAADARDALWVRPDLVGEVEFAEFTPGGILRQARWRGLRPDKDPAEVARED